MQTEKKFFVRDLENKRRYIDDFIVVFIDIDNLKLVNDDQGHLVGDEVVSCLEQAIVDVVSPNAYFCRWGGDEYVLLLNSGTSEDVESLLSDIRTNFLNSIPVSILNIDKGLPVDLSYGWERCTGMSVRDCIEYANFKMLHNKKTKKTLFQTFLACSRQYSRESVIDALKKMEIIYGNGN